MQGLQASTSLLINQADGMCCEHNASVRVNGIASSSVSSLSAFFPLLNISTSFGKYARCSICARAMLTSKVTEWDYQSSPGSIRVPSIQSGLLRIAESQK